MSFTDFTENKVVDHVLGTAAFTMPTSILLGIFTADPGETGSVTNEATGAGYARQTITFTAASGGLASSNTDVTFTNLNAQTITHMALFDQSGNMLMKGALNNPKTIGAGGSLPFDSGSLMVSVG